MVIETLKKCCITPVSLSNKMNGGLARVFFFFAPGYGTDDGTDKRSDVISGWNHGGLDDCRSRPKWPEAVAE